ncbi:ATP-NAD kinase family protein [Halorussus vallis]|uniref:ATP-NAD kinase family protein n=2 Tax=Halorussus TaxID=1070314 RepID=UPI00209EF7E2|nr:ATP-NAD kinase family protein [Halorussus vallis]USZ76281.1 ATP-NAD kinase family protein [Halorussus vallis]
MRRIGVVVNPIAGMGGRVGLKGTDGKVAEARERGAEPRAPERAVDALAALRSRVRGTRAPASEEAKDGAATSPDGTEQGAEILTCAGEMGEDEAREAGFDPTVVCSPAGEQTTVGGAEMTAGDAETTVGDSETSAEDTREAVRRFAEEGVDLILFVGGDGTAVDVAETLDELDAEIPMLGVPAGVKVYSAVFGVTPEAAGRVAADFDRTETREVNDIDEAAYREGEVRAELKALAEVPVAEDLQSSKQLGGGTVESLAAGVADDARGNPGTTYVLGPGGTVGAVKEALGFEGSPLGVDVWRDGEVLVRDASEVGILDHLGEHNVVVVSPIGGQGFVFGRGNDQLSPEVLRRSEVEVVASKRKLDDVGALRVDTGDEAVDESLRGWRKVRVGRFERRMMKVV